MTCNALPPTLVLLSILPLYKDALANLSHQFVTNAALLFSFGLKRNPASSYSQEIRQSCLVTLDPQPAVLPFSSPTHSAEWAIFVPHLVSSSTSHHSARSYLPSQCGRGLQKPLRPWRWSHLICLAQHIMQQCDLRRAINIQDSLKYLVAWCGNMPLHFLGDIPMSTRTSDTGPEYRNQNNESRNWAQMTLWSCTGRRLDYGAREINPEHRGYMYLFWSRGSVMGLPLKAICKPNELFHLNLTFKKNDNKHMYGEYMS